MSVNDKEIKEFIKIGKEMLKEDAILFRRLSQHSKLRFPQFVQFREFLIIGQSKEHILTSVSRVLGVGGLGLHIVDKMPEELKDCLKRQEISRKGNKEWEEIEYLINKKVHDRNEKAREAWDERQARLSFNRLTPEEQKEIRTIHSKAVRDILKGNI